MTPHGHTKPFDHIIIDDFFDENSFKQVFEEILSLTPSLVDPKETKAAAVGGKPIKRGSGICIDSVYKQRNLSKILTFFDRLFCSDVYSAANDAGCLFKYYLKKTNADYTLLQSYGNGDFYDTHDDIALFTSVTLFYKEPKKYTGGILCFPDYNYEIDLNNNQTIIFPSGIFHKVSKITKKDNDIANNRFTITKFIHYKTIN